MKLKTSWHFTKWDGLNKVLAIQYIPCFKNFAALQIFSNIFLLKWWIKWRKFWAQRISWSSKILFVFKSRLNFYFLQMVIFATLFQRCPTLLKSTLKMTTLFWRCLTMFKSTLKWTTLIRVCSTLEISTLTYTTLFQRWFDAGRRHDVISI